MEGFLWVIFLFLIFQRLGELALAHANKKWMLARGAKEWGENHYGLFVLLHSLFFLSIIIENRWATYDFSSFLYVALPVFVLLQLMRMWCIATLGRRWNTRILVLPGEEPIKKGMYRYMKHPNYVVVFFELLTIPLLFDAYVTALIFPFLHLLVLTVRIPAEEQALED